MTGSPKCRVTSALVADTWELAKGRAEAGPLVFRYRTPILGPDGVEGYSRVLRILWLYGTEDSGAMPSTSDSTDMEQFEDRLCDVLEIDAHAFLAAVLTFDGARQWVFYISDVEECGRRLEGMPQNVDSYPIEIDAFDDPRWQYLRTEILLRVPVHA
jgi:Family of unknown function (DUF695)